MWEIIFYEKPNGRCPGKEFLDELSLKVDLPHIVHRLDLLAEFGQALKRPYVAPLRDNILELRVKTQSGEYRFFHFYFEGKTIVITHGYQKKTDKVADSEIDKAIEYRKDYLARKRGQRR